MTGTPMFGTDAFSEVLDIVHVRGETARVVTPEGPLEHDVPAGKPCVYIVEQGSLAITPEGGEPVVLHEKQIALMLQGTGHTAVFSDPRRNTAQARLIDPQTGERLQPAINCFCGSFTVDGDLAARVLQSLPQVIVLDGLAENPIEWVDVMCELVLRELGATRPGASLMVSRLLDLLLVVILRRWAQSDDSLPGWLAAAKDERIAGQSRRSTQMRRKLSRTQSWQTLRECQCRVSLIASNRSWAKAPEPTCGHGVSIKRQRLSYIPVRRLRPSPTELDTPRKKPSAVPFKPSSTSRHHLGAVRVRADTRFRIIFGSFVRRTVIRRNSVQCLLCGTLLTFKKRRSASLCSAPTYSS